MNIKDSVGKVIGLVALFDTSPDPERQLRLAGASKQEVLNKNRRSKDRDMEKKLQAMVDKIAQANNLYTFDYQVYLLGSDNINAFTPGGGVILSKKGCGPG